MNDNSTTINELRSLVQNFVSSRNWQPFQTPKNVAMSISIESAELMEKFQWIPDKDTQKMIQDIDQLAGIKDELADVIIYCLDMANVCKIDISSAVKEKLQKNEIRYPALDTDR